MKLPGSYNEAKFVTFGMLIYLICWVIFGLVYTNTPGQYHPALEMVVILISAYGILFCLFLPKYYIILFKKEANTQCAFQRKIWRFNSRDVLTESLETRNNSLGGSGGVENLGLQPECPLAPYSTLRGKCYRAFFSNELENTLG